MSSYLLYEVIIVIKNINRWAFFSADILSWFCFTNNIKDGSVLSPVCHDSVTVSQHEQHQDPETEAAKWNSAFINFAYTDQY